MWIADEIPRTNEVMHDQTAFKGQQFPAPRILFSLIRPNFCEISDYDISFIRPEMSRLAVSIAFFSYFAGSELIDFGHIALSGLSDNTALRPKC